MDVEYLNVGSFDDAELGSRVRGAWSRGAELHLVGHMGASTPVACHHGVEQENCIACGDEVQRHPESDDFGVCSGCGDEQDETGVSEESWAAYDRLVEMLPLEALREALKREARIRATAQMAAVRRG